LLSSFWDVLLQIREETMKFAAVLALIVVAVSAANHFKQPKMPCAWTQDIDVYRRGGKYAHYRVEMNGRFMKFTGNEDDDETYAELVRSDIGNDGNVTFFYMDGSDCVVEELELNDLAYLQDMYTYIGMMYEYDKDWDHKKTETYRDKKCDYYYDDEPEEGNIYVYEGRIFAVVREKFEFVIEYKDEAPMDVFVMSEKDFPKCVEKDKKVAEVPSDDFVFCAASSMKVAIVAVVAAVISALF